MIYFSTIQSKSNNRATSSISEDYANKLVIQMDNSNCHNCHNCRDCYNCYHCYDCDNCYDCHSCHNCHNCDNCRNCNSCYDCNNCYKCANCDSCDDCHNCDNFNNPQSENIIQLSNLNWTVSFNSKYMAIGCQFHSIKFWKTASNETIAKMDSNALEFWKKYKDSIFSIINSTLN